MTWSTRVNPRLALAAVNAGLLHYQNAITITQRVSLRKLRIWGNHHSHRVSLCIIVFFLQNNLFTANAIINAVVNNINTSDLFKLFLTLLYLSQVTVVGVPGVNGQHAPKLVAQENRTVSERA